MYLRPLLAISLERKRRGERPLFNSHMFDGSTLPLEENLEIASALLDQCVEADIVLEVECGVVGGEEDGVSGEDAPSEKLYTTPEDLLRVAEVLGTGERGRYLLAATFGNVHGVYAPGSVKLRPKVLLEGQKALAERYGERRFLRLRLPRRLGLRAGDDRRGGLVRRREDERRHRHAVRLHATDRGPHDGRRTTAC